MARDVAVNHFAAAPPEERDIVEKVCACVEAFERGIGPDFRDTCNRRYKQYRGFRAFRDNWTKAGPNDRDGVLYDAKRDWGSHLHIPLSFRTIETQVPAAIAHRPRLLYIPAKERWAENVANVRYLIDRQQDDIDIDLPFQAVMRSGRIYGLGVGKTYWLKDWAPRRRVTRTTFRGKLASGNVFQPDYKLGDLEQSLEFDDPMFEDVDIFDFMWDPFGSHLGRGTGRCGYLIHRVWLSLEVCLDRIRSGLWATETAKALTEDDLRSMGSGQKYDEVWQDRMIASGFPAANLTTRGEHVHELLEWHDGHQVHAVLDRQAFVQGGESPCVGTYAFQGYRPTPLQKQMVGIGDLEPIEHLQRELDTLRSQRRDAATLALAASMVYDENMVDEEDLVFGPGTAIPVRNASRVQDAIMPLLVKEPPGTSYQEEQVIRADFDAVSGINDALMPQTGGAAGTATEAQLVQASLSRRVELGSRRFEIEVVRHVARCFLYLNQRMILTERERVQPAQGLTYEQAAHEGRWRTVQLGPAELQGDYVIVPEGGSMAARNVPQDRQDAQLFLGLAQNPYMDPRRATMKALELLGVRDPEGWLKQQQAPVPPAALQILQQAGVDPNIIQFAVSRAQAADPMLNPDQGPNAQQVDQMMGTQQGAPA